MGQQNKEIICPNVQMKSGYEFKGEDISELVKKIINMFTDKELSRDEAMEVLEEAKEYIGEFSCVLHIT